MKAARHWDGIGEGMLWISQGNQLRRYTGTCRQSLLQGQEKFSQESRSRPSNEGCGEKRPASIVGSRTQPFMN